jgi:hypothetical protein
MRAGSRTCAKCGGHNGGLGLSPQHGVVRNGVSVTRMRRVAPDNAQAALEKQKVDNFNLAERKREKGAAGSWGRAGRARTRSGDGEGWGRDRGRVTP